TGMSLWAYADIKDKEFLTWAEQFKEAYRAKVFDTPMETMHDVGFLYSPYAVMLYSLTGDEDYKNMAVKAADALAMRYEPKGGYIRAWGRMDYKTPEYVDEELAKDHFFTESKGVAIIDCMMNLPLLFWSSEVTGHPFYKRIAMMHADTTIKYFIREDYSLIHAFRFSEETGEPIGESNYCGYSNGSCWTRGMSWAIYGFAIAYNYTNEERYLDASIKLLEKFMRASKHQAPVWDFHLPEFEEQNLDTSAVAVTLCGILELEKKKSNKKLMKAKEILKNILEPFIDYDENVMGILKEQNGLHQYTSYGDYYLVESLMKEKFDIKVW
ncbi:MAG: hypothetical protein E7403_06885, partial [Ruminococcaceae bacterium]|nr:hypothetical protein [Oscillospiraceae bacterium]